MSAIAAKPQATLLNFEDYRSAARRALPRFVFDFIDGAAERELSKTSNERDLDAISLLPRYLRDVSRVDTSQTLFGQRWPMPFAVAPMGFNGLLRPGADLDIARAAASCEVPFIQSTASNMRLEDIAQGAKGVRWLQLYLMGGRAIAEHMLRRAQAQGFGALILTVDVAVGGDRERDTRNGMRMPFRLTPKTAIDILTHPRWALRFAGKGQPDFANLKAQDEAPASAELAAALGNREMDRSVDWDIIAWLRERWDKPILLKGVLHPADAALAVAAGVDGLIVSNHGGRQLDVAPSTIAALPSVLRAVDGAIPVLIDGGFRSGSDVARALALGARAVLIGRPLLWGVAVGGEEGAARVLHMIASGLLRTMTLLGAASLNDLLETHPGTAHV